MISAFQIFKIIFGIVISAVVLVLVFRFSSSYVDIGESSGTASVMLGFEKSVGDVYASGIPVDYRIPGAEEHIIAYNPPNMQTDVASLDMDPVPVIFRKGENLVLYRNNYDLGWWRFYFVEALPETSIILVPLDRTDTVFDTMDDIALSMPSTENTETKIYFGFGCNRTAVYFAGWEREQFLNKFLLAYKGDDKYVMNPCRIEEVPPQFRNAIFVTISETFQEVEGVLIMPVSGETGYVYLNTSNPDDFHVYKSRADLAALILGGKKAFTYINGKFADGLDVATDLKLRELALISSKMQSRCLNAFSEFRKTLEELKASDKTQIDVRAAMESLSEKMAESKEQFEVIQTMGCD